MAKYIKKSKSHAERSADDLQIKKTVEQLLFDIEN